MQTKSLQVLELVQPDDVQHVNKPLPTYHRLINATNSSTNKATLLDKASIFVVGGDDTTTTKVYQAQKYILVNDQHLAVCTRLPVIQNCTDSPFLMAEATMINDDDTDDVLKVAQLSKPVVYFLSPQEHHYYIISYK